MACLRKCVFLPLVVLLIASASLVLPVYAYPQPSTPEFTVKLVTHTVEIPATTSTDQFTGQTTTTPATHSEYQTIDITIKNQPFTPYNDENASDNRVNLLYNIRYKGPHTEEWTTLYGDDSYPIENYTAQYTVVSLALRLEDNTGGLRTLNIPANTSAVAEFQVKAMIGYLHRVPVMFSGFHFEGETSDWSGTQAVSIDGANVQTPTVAPTQAPTATSTATNLPTIYPTESETQQNLLRGFDWQTVMIAVLAVAVVVLALAVALQRRGNRKVEGQ
jgi:hypothetical protein